MVDNNVGSSDGSEYSDASQEMRPNRWNGAHSTWQTLVGDEMELSTGIDAVRDSDLSLHLYNVHALKKRVRAFENADDTEKRKLLDMYPGIPAGDQFFNPPSTWTAWPLRPEDDPMEGEQVGPDDSFEAYTFKLNEKEKPSRELEDVLVSTTLKFARDRFNAREAADGKVDRDFEKLTRKAERQRLERLEQNSKDSGAESDDEEVAAKDDKLLEKDGEVLVPVISADDGTSRSLLLPSIRHTMSKLDEILMALHHARKACRKCSMSTEEGLSEEETVAGAVVGDNISSSVAGSSAGSTYRLSTAKRPKGRPRKFASLADRTKINKEVLSETLDEVSQLRVKKSHRGRPLKLYPQLDGESEQDYLVRIAQHQKKALPSFAPPRKISISFSKSPERGRARSERSITYSPLKRNPSTDDRYNRRANPRDWSEVLACSALVGLPQDVIARATQRCAKLFGEGMVMRASVEMPYSEHKAGDMVTRYDPDTIPDLDAPSPMSVSDAAGHSPPFESERDKTPKQNQRIRSAKKTNHLVGRQTCYCTVPECPRRLQGFKDTAALRKHLRRAHLIRPSEVDDWVVPSDEEFDGAVHVDGYMKPVKFLGWGLGEKGPYVKKRGGSGNDVTQDNSRDSGGEDDDQVEEEELVETSGED